MDSFLVRQSDVHIIKETLEQAGFEQVPSGNDYSYSLKGPKGGRVNLYLTGKIVIQGKDNEKDTLRQFLDDYIKHLFVEPSSAGGNVCFVYTLSDCRQNSLSGVIETHAGLNGYALSKTTPRHARYCYAIKDGLDNKVTVTQYASGKLILQGLETSLWEDLTTLIGSFLCAEVQTIVAHVKAKPGQEIEVLALITASDHAEAIDAARSKLGNCYAFLNPHDQHLVESSQILIESGVPLSEYFAYVSSTIKAFEGFFKKALIEIGAFTEPEISYRSWDFGCVYDSRTGTINSRVLNCLSAESVKRSKQESVIRELSKMIFNCRNPYFHNGPRPNRELIELKDAKSLHDQILSLMKASHQLLI